MRGHSLSSSVLICALAASAGFELPAQGVLESALFDNLPWRQIGPGRVGGRVSDIEVHPERPSTIFVGAATGGVFKSVNNGMTWRPVFDNAGSSLAIGDMAIAPSDPLILWVGTGETASDQSSGSVGDGVYKSIDGGETWQHMGLSKSWHIARIVIDPHDPNMVFVGVSGALWGPNAERGVYRSENGGRTWERVLFIDEDTGISDLAIDPGGKIVYASAYQRRRHSWAHVRTGPQSALYRSTDGGGSWKKLTEGLPEGNKGRIALAVAPSDPLVVHASVEGDGGGWYRSQNRGNSWERMSGQSTSYWYGRIFVDPTDAETVWSMGTNMGYSTDGGQTWDSGRAPLIHVDHHTLWINPQNTEHIMLGNDGGFHMTFDGGGSWDFLDNIPMGQFYAIGVDNRESFWVYGGLQDNGSWGVASRTHNSTGILNDDVVYVTGGDGFYAAIDPRDPNLVYSESQNGGLSVTDLRTRVSRRIKPSPTTQGERYRFNWNSPLFLSPHDPDSLYFGGNKLFKTSDQGETWAEISPDLSLDPQDLEDRLVMGMKPTLKPHATITTINESPVQQGVIYAGTDDGRLHLTVDDGASWEDLSDRLPMPEDRFATRVLPSHHAAGTAYVAFGRYLEANDFRPYLFRTDDFGKTWTSVAGNLPAKAVVKGLAEHPRNPELLFAGVHNGLFVTVDRGENWVRMGGNLPPVAIDDIKIPARRNAVVLGTYGRGIIVLDDLAMLEHLDASILASDAHLFPPPETTRHYRRRRWMFSEAAMFKAPNAPDGMPISYYLREDSAPEVRPATSAPRRGQGQRRGGVRRGGQARAEPAPTPATVQIQVLDSQGQVVADLRGPDGQGIHQVVWNLRSTTQAGRRGRGRGQGGRGQGRGTRRGGGAQSGGPEEFTIKLIARGTETTQKVVVHPDPDR